MDMFVCRLILSFVFDFNIIYSAEEDDRATTKPTSRGSQSDPASSIRPFNFNKAAFANLFPLLRSSALFLAVTAVVYKAVTNEGEGIRSWFLKILNVFDNVNLRLWNKTFNYYDSTMRTSQMELEADYSEPVYSAPSNSKTEFSTDNSSSFPHPEHSSPSSEELSKPSLDITNSECEE